MNNNQSKPDNKIHAFDEGWDEFISGIQAEGFGLTLEEFKKLETLETEEEREMFFRKHSTLYRDEELSLNC